MLSDRDRFFCVMDRGSGALDPDGKQREGPHPAGKHGENQNHLAAVGKPRRNPRGKPHGAEGRHLLKQQLDKAAFRLQNTQQEGPYANQQQGQQDNN